MSLATLILIDVAAIVILTFGLYWPRHRRKNMVVAYLTANIGVAAVASVLVSSSINAGLGLGLFGILSIIRLRSDELDHTDIAYYFGALALGLFAGLGGSLTWATPAMSLAILAALYVGDHPEFFSQYRSQIVNLDSAFTDEAALRMRLESVLDAKVHKITVRRVDLVNDTTTVDVRYELPRSGDRRRFTPTPAAATGDRHA